MREAADYGLEEPTVRLLSFVGQLKPQIDRGHSRRDVDPRDRAQGESVSPEAGEEVILLPAALALALELRGGDQARRHPRACRGPLEERQVVRLDELDLDGQDLGRGLRSGPGARRQEPLPDSRHGPGSPGNGEVEERVRFSPGPAEPEVSDAERLDALHSTGGREAGQQPRVRTCPLEKGDELIVGQFDLDGLRPGRHRPHLRGCLVSGVQHARHNDLNSRKAITATSER
jgi:hypothetical protein